MELFFRQKQQKGIGFIDVIIGSALMLLIFVAIAGVIQLAVRLTGHSKAKVGGIALATEQVELLRSLSYENVGTVGGIPAGTVPQEETIVLNNISYTRSTLVQYVDDPADGTGLEGTDENGVPTDYKVAKVSVVWSVGGVEQSTTMVSNIVPNGIETNEGGGTLFVSVFDALGVPVEGVDVHVVSDEAAIDTVRVTNALGRVVVLGSPAAGSYEITVSKTGYSTAQTYDVTTENPDPNPGHLTVAEGQTTSASFAIDLLASNIVRTFMPPELDTWEDTFGGSSGIAATTSTEVFAGQVRLEDLGGGVYPGTGSVRAVTIAPADLYEWGSVSWGDVVPPDTDIRYRVYSGGVLVPDAVLPGNAAGFTTSPLDISSLDPNAYGSIALDAALSTTDAAVTPGVNQWTVAYSVGPLPLPDIAFTIQGSKTVGTDGEGLPLYKFETTAQTDGVGEYVFAALEWDTYTVALDADALGLNVQEVCPFQPYALNPGVDVTTDIILVPQTDHSLLLSVEDAVTGTVLSGASARLYRAGYDETQETSACGQTFFADVDVGTVAGGNAYTFEVSQTGYQPQTVADVEVNGSAVAEVSLQPAP